MLTIAETNAVALEVEQPHHAADIENLNALAFGPGRFARTAFRLREGADPAIDLGRVALFGERLIGSVQFTPITIGETSPALLLGPLCVHPDFANRGYGLRLMTAGLEATQRAGHHLVILVGDAPYYGRAGFVAVPHGQIQLPGPVDPNRLLALELVPGALQRAGGMVMADSIAVSVNASSLT